MFPGRYFASRFFAPRFFAKFGAAPTPPPTSARSFLVSNGDINMTGQGVGTVGYTVLQAQTANIAVTTVFAADRTGLYRVNVSALNTVAGAAGTLASVITWATYTKTAFTGMSLSVLGTSRNFSQLLHLTAADVVQYSATITGGVGSPEYDLYVTVERIWPSS